MSFHVRQRGISLIETIMFMVIVGVAVGGVMGVFMTTTRSSADPLVRKQALAIAESLLEEVRLMPFTFCDPDDPNVSTATRAVVGVGPTFCATAAEMAMGAEGTETRYDLATPYDNVNDYNGFTMAGGIRDIANNPIPGLGNYGASVTVAPVAFGVIAATDADGAAQALLITVTVTGPDNQPVRLAAIRTRYAPNL